jgi:DNA polymerase
MTHAAIEAGIEAINADCEDLLYDDVMRLTRNTIRGSIIAPPGKKLVVSDLANIEGRGGAWFGGEEWKLQAFRDFDAAPEGEGIDLYKLSYAAAFNIDVKDVDDKQQRQIGKVMELMLQYEGGVGAFITGAATYRIDLEDMTRRVIGTLPADVMSEARGLYDFMVKKNRSTFGLPVDTYLVCDSLKRLWRRRHPGIVSLWKDMKLAAIQAICIPGATVDCRKFKMRRDGTWLRIMLPSGNYLCYPSIDYSNDKISYMGMNQYTRKWSRIYTYGGKFFENANQSFAGDLLRYRWHEIEDYGYELVLTVYDENVTEAPQSPEFNAEHLSSLMVPEIPYAVGLPLAAKGYEAQRYRKD